MVENEASVIFQALVSSVPFAVSALIGVAGTIYYNVVVAPNLRVREKVRLINAELRNTKNHYERSIANIKSFLDETRTGREVDYRKCKLSDTGFLSFDLSYLAGLPADMAQSTLQLALLYRNQNSEIDYTVDQLAKTSDFGDEREAKFDKIRFIVKRMRDLIQFTDAAITNNSQYLSTMSIWRRDNKSKLLEIPLEWFKGALKVKD